MKLGWSLVARALALLWAGFWALFFVVESWVWRTPVLDRLPWVALGAFFLFLALAPWRWQFTGGILLVIAGLAAGVAYSIWSPPQLPPLVVAWTTAAFAAPPLAAGILFLTHSPNSCGTRKP